MLIVKLVKAASVLAICAIVISGAFAQGKKPVMKAMTPACPVCKMPLAAKASKMDPVAVKIHGRVMYCCAGCKMPAGMLAKKPMAKKPMAKKAMSKMGGKGK
jgi:hypothetical protein